MTDLTNSNANTLDDAKRDDGYYFYKHYSIDNEILKKINFFSEHKLRYSIAETFNDPFEFSFFTDYCEKTLAQKTSITGGQNNPNLMKTYLEQEFKNMSLKMSHNFFTCCLNLNPLNVLLWSHYANSHQGFAIEYKFPLDTLKGNLPQPIDYNNEYPVFKFSDKVLDEMMTDGYILNNINSFPGIKKTYHPKLIELRKFADDISNQSFMRKSLDWAYEKEFRLILPKSKYQKNNVKGFHFDGTNIFENITISNISSIILGVNNRKTEQIIETQLGTLSKHNIKIYRAKLNDKNYGLHVPDHPWLNLK